MTHLLARLALLLQGRWSLLTARIGQTQWTLPAWGPALLAGGAVAAILLAAICYRRTTEGLTLRNRITLGTLRAVALFCLLVMISGAVCTIRLARPVRGDLLLVVDDSPSMTLRDGSATRTAEAERALAGGLGRDLAARGHVRTVRTSTFSPGDTNGPQDLVRALVRAAASPSPRPVDAIVFVSDGTAIGADPLRAAAAEVPAPVSTLAVGATNGLRDVILESVSVPPFAYRQDRAVAAVTVRALGFDGDAALHLLHVQGGSEKEIGACAVTLSRDGAPAIGRLEFVAEPAGIQEYAVRLDPRAGELTDRNNAIRFHLDVRDEKINVLFVEGEPSWEYRYAKQALESDPAVRFCGLVRLPNTEWFYQGPEKRPDGNPFVAKPKDGFPIPLDELDAFDVLILGDLERKAYERGDGFGSVVSFVQGHGGGLMTIGGLEVYGAGDFEGTPLAGLLPFDVRRETKQQLINRFQVKLTSEGLMHPVTQLEFDPVKNQQAWDGLPWVEGGNAIRGVRPGATGLLVHPTLRTAAGPRPILAAWQNGRGRVLSSALDGTWHWRLAEKTATDYHQRYWSLAARWLAGDIRERQPLGALVAEEAVLEAGRAAHFGIVLRQADGSPLLDAAVDFVLQAGEDGEPLLTRASADPAVPGRYAVVYTPPRSGPLKVHADVRTADGQTRAHEQTFLVGESRAEFLRVVPEPLALAALAEATGGRHAALQDSASLRLPPLPERWAAQRVTLNVWQAPGLLGVLLLCLCVEWFMRKRRGLA